MVVFDPDILIIYHNSEVSFKFMANVEIAAWIIN